MLSAILRQIRLERDGFAVNRSAIKEAIEVYRNLTDGNQLANVFKVELERHILEETETYYKLEGENLNNDMNSGALGCKLMNVSKACPGNIPLSLVTT